MVKNRFKFLKIYFMFVYVRVGPHEASGQHGAADSFPLLCVVPGNGTQCLGNKCLYPLRKLTGP